MSCQFFIGNWYAATQSVLATGGLGICALIVMHLLKEDNPLTRKLCGDRGTFDCDRVLSSPQATLFKGVTWADVGLIYFSTFSLLLLQAAITGRVRQALLLMAIPCTLAFFASFLSVWYQWRVIGSWCRMCLMVAAIVWLQEGVTLFCFRQGIQDPRHFFTDISRDAESILPVALLWVVSLLLSLFWLSVKPSVVKAKEVEAARQQLRVWKRNPSLFVMLLKKYAPIDDSRWDREFTFGKVSAPIRITVAMNLYCPACKREYKHLVGLLNRFPNLIHMTIRIRNSVKDPMALPHILDKFFSTGNPRDQQKILSDWFESMNLAKWKKNTAAEGLKNDHSVLIQQYDAWFLENHIVRTPTIFVNGYHLPVPFTIMDLKQLIPDLPGALSDMAAVAEK